MKTTIYLLISLIIIGCGTRTKQAEKEKSILQESREFSKNENVSSQNSSETKTDLSQYLKEIGLKINSTGKPYQLQYNGVVFSGDANLEFSDREEKTIVKTVFNTITTYKSETTHKSVTNYKSQVNKKSMDLKSERSSLWLYVLIGVISIVVWELIKKYNPFSYGKF